MVGDDDDGRVAAAIRRVCVSVGIGSVRPLGRGLVSCWGRWHDCATCSDNADDDDELRCVILMKRCVKWFVGDTFSGQCL